MRTTCRRRLAAGLTAGGLVLLFAGPAMAHPTFNPNALTAGKTHAIDLVVPHGCVEGGGAPDPGETTSATVELAIELNKDVVSFSATSVAGWSVSTRDGTVVWTDEGGATTAPIIFPVVVEISPNVPVGQSVHLKVAQDCVDGTMLWQALPGEEGDPAAVLEVADTVGTSDVEAEGHAGHGGAAVPDEEGVGSGEETGEQVIDEAVVAAAADHDADAGGDGYASTSIFVLVFVIGSIILILRKGAPEEIAA